MGHYVGALKNWLELQDKYDCYFLIADYQALGDHLHDIELIRESVLEVALEDTDLKEDELRKILNPNSMTEPGISGISVG